MAVEIPKPKHGFRREMSFLERLYLPENGVPHLARDPDVGRVMVVGGRMAVEGVDYQRPEETGEARVRRPTR